MTIRGLATIALAGVLLSGCQGTAGSVSERGLDLELAVARGGNSFARYRVDRDGTLAFAGGRDAIAGDDSWSGALEPGERERLETLLRGWTGPASAGTPAVYTIRWRDDAGGWHRARAGDGEPVVAAVDELLAHAARRRHAEVLDRLPKPTRETDP